MPNKLKHAKNAKKEIHTKKKKTINKEKQKSKDGAHNNYNNKNNDSENVEMSWESCKMDEAADVVAAVC